MQVTCPEERITELEDLSDIGIWEFSDVHKASPEHMLYACFLL